MGPQIAVGFVFYDASLIENIVRYPSRRAKSLFERGADGRPGQIGFTIMRSPAR